MIVRGNLAGLKKQCLSPLVFKKCSSSITFQKILRRFVPKQMYNYFPTKYWCECMIDDAVQSKELNFRDD